MTTVMVQYRVRDYETWRKEFDANEPARTAATLSDCRVYRNVADGNDVIMTYVVGDEGKLRQFLESAELKRRMEAAGVVGKPIVLRDS